MAVVIENVTKCYGRLRAVDGISLNVKRGELFAFLGPNGAGKTTTIKMMTGLLTPDSGTITVCGHPMATDSQLAKARIAFVPDQPFLYGKLTAREFMHFVGEMYGIDRNILPARIEHYMAQLAVTGYADQLAEGYSHGMKQRVVLAAALLHEPEVLVVDEPMVGLDPRTARTVKDIFREWANAGRTVFMSTHTLEVAEAIADRIAIINHGRIVACGTLDELKAKAAREHRLEDIFLELTDPKDPPELEEAVIPM
ncbi:MAG: ABC transporter ATP-binding protein [Phycisphaerales bacterium]|nr:ABC transporter ATP-binding protein [Phycisphaerales bacterium]MCB9854155.1 ABC transporter ATP-binding protein [Phycisphaerales bacterium]MCB9864709.1 ABC transporter ATP-binding protein [Phycisphaerales bacterium]